MSVAWRIGRKLGRTSSHRKALLRNQVTALIESERIKTTLAKAKETRRYADMMVTLAKKGDKISRIRAQGFIRTPEAVAKLFDGPGSLAARFANRQGGYTRVIKAGFRFSDQAAMAWLEYLDGPFSLPNKEERLRRRQQVEGGVADVLALDDDAIIESQVVDVDSKQ